MPAIDPFLSFESAMKSVINERPVQITRQRWVRDDSFRDKELFIQGTFNVRIEFVNALPKETHDEKGDQSRLIFQLVGYNLPTTVLEDGATVPLFKPNDVIIDQYSNSYRVTSPQVIQGKLVFLFLELAT